MSRSVTKMTSENGQRKRWHFVQDVAFCYPWSQIACAWFIAPPFGISRIIVVLWLGGNPFSTIPMMANQTSHQPPQNPPLKTLQGVVGVRRSVGAWENLLRGHCNGTPAHVEGLDFTLAQYDWATLNWERHTDFEWRAQDVHAFMSWMSARKLSADSCLSAHLHTSTVHTHLHTRINFLAIRLCGSHWNSQA